jgi:hypothetical protein
MSEAKTNAWQQFETNQGQPQTYGDPYGPPTYDEWLKDNPPTGGGSGGGQWWNSILNSLPDIIGLFDKPGNTPAPTPGPSLPAPAQQNNQILNFGILVIFGIVTYFLIKKI